MSNQIEEKIDKLLSGFYNFEKKTDKNFLKLEKRMDDLESRMDKLETKVDGLEVKMNSRFDSVEKSIRSIKGIVGENMSDIADINRRLGKAN